MSLRLPGMNSAVEEIERPGEDVAEAPTAAPLNTGLASSSGPLGVKVDEPNPVLQKLKGFSLLGFIIVAAGGVLFGMRLIGKGGSLQLLDIKIDYPLDAGQMKVVSADHQAIINDLSMTGEFDQVPLEEIHINPFMWRGLVTDVAGTPAVVDDSRRVADAERKKREQRRKEVQQAFTKLELNSIIGRGAASVARISGELVRVGDKVGYYFSVEAIEGRSVQLLADGESFFLTMDQ